MKNEFDRGDMDVQSDVAGAAARMKQTVSDAASHASGKISELGRKTVNQIYATREPIASSLEKTVSALHEKGDTAAKAAHTAADKLQSTAPYVRQNDVRAMIGLLGESLASIVAKCERL